MSSEAPLAPSAGGQAFWAATIDYVEAKIFKPRTGMEDKVRLRPITVRRVEFRSTVNTSSRHEDVFRGG